VSGFTLRAAAADDRTAVLDVLEVLFDPPGQRPADYSRERAESAYEWAVTTPEADILLATDARELIGLCTVYLDFPSLRFGWRCWIEDLVVRPDRRSQGVGRLLLEAAADWGRQRGASHLELDSAATRHAAHRFYAAAGMSQSSLLFARPID
jgi:GNAT superfamily N-acetyltransferase